MNSPSPAFAYNARLGRGINMGNMLEAPRGGWGSELLPLKLEYFQKIKEQGFDSVRIPIRWSDYAQTEAPYTIEPEFFAQVDEILTCALDNGLATILDLHHYEEMHTHPLAHQDRLVGLWGQIANHYQSYPDGLSFEVLNEPTGALTAEIWNPLLARVVQLLRQTNPGRTIIAGPTDWNGINALPSFDPPTDPNLILTVHYYLPMPLTHQGAHWVAGSDAWLGTQWTDTDAEKQAVIDDFDRVQSWAAQRSLPVYLGEFGAYQTADMPSRVRWTNWVARQAETRGWSWGYWEFCAGFGAYDRKTDQWIEPLLHALIAEK